MVEIYRYITVDASQGAPFAIAEYFDPDDSTAGDLLAHIPTRQYGTLYLQPTSDILTMTDGARFKDAQSARHLQVLRSDWRAKEVILDSMAWPNNARLSDIKSLGHSGDFVIFVVLCVLIPQPNLGTTTEEAPARRADHFSSIRNQRAVAASIQGKVKPPSTSANNEQLLKTEHPDNNEAIYDGRPDILTGPSITIYHPIFAEFQRRLREVPKAGDIPLDDVMAASLFISTSAQYFNTESDRQHALRTSVEHFLEGIFIETTLRYGKTSFRPDGHHAVSCGLFGLLEPNRKAMLDRLDEVKNGVGLGDRDPIDQAAKGYLIVASSPELEKLREVSCMPSFLLGIAGPFITVAGAIYLDGVVSQRLTHMISLIPDASSTTPIEHYASEREKCVYQIANLFRALRDCQVKLQAEYHAMSTTSSARKDVMVPAPHISSFSPDSSTSFSLQYLRPFFSRRSNRTVFLAEAQDNDKRMKCVVKFTARYCQEAHLLMQKAGVAPTLLYYNFEPTVGKFCVITQYVEGSESPDARPTTEGIEKLQTALKTLHAHSYVFGDLRDANILVDAAGCPQLIDFDWSGQEDTVCYPSNLNMKDIEWAEGVKPGGKIIRQHDEEMLQIFISGLSTTG